MSEFDWKSWINKDMPCSFYPSDGFVFIRRADETPVAFKLPCKYGESGIVTRDEYEGWRKKRLREPLP